MKRYFVVAVVSGLAAAFGMTACGYRRSVPVNVGPGEAAHARRYLIDMGRTPVPGSTFRVAMVTKTTTSTHAEVDGEQQKQSEEETTIDIDAVGDVLESTPRGISKARYTLSRLLINGKDAVPKDTVITFDKDAPDVLTIGDQPVPSVAAPAVMLMVTGLEPLNDDALVGLSRRQSLGATWNIDSLAAAVEFENGGISVDPDQIKGRSHFAELGELDGVASMTIQTEVKLRGARPKKPPPGTTALASDYEVKSEITVPLRIKTATLRDERSRTHSVVQVRSERGMGDDTESTIHLTLTTTLYQALRVRPISGGDGFDAENPEDLTESPAPEGRGADVGAAPSAKPDAFSDPAAVPPDTETPSLDDAPTPDGTWDPGRGMDSGFPRY